MLRALSNQSDVCITTNGRGVSDTAPNMSDVEDADDRSISTLPDNMSLSSEVEIVDKYRDDGISAVKDVEIECESGLLELYNLVRS